MPVTRWDHTRHCDALTGELARCLDTVTGADLTREVPTCPGWDLAELVRHIGSVHRWAASMVRECAAERFRLADLDLGVPADASELSTWFGSGGDVLLATLRRADPDAPMWAWGGDQHARFWSRRMLHETTVHRADAQLALGLAVHVDPETACDGVDELLDNLPHARAFAPEVGELRGDGESLRFAAHDTGAHWLVRLEPEGFSWTRSSDGGPLDGGASVRVSAPAADLLLLLYGRLPAADPRFELDGTPSLLSRWLECSAL